MYQDSSATTTWIDSENPPTQRLTDARQRLRLRVLAGDGADDTVLPVSGQIIVHHVRERP